MNSRKKERSFNIRKKLVIGISAVAAITYGVSAVFLFYLADFFGEFIQVNERVYILLVFALGILWCGILGFLAAGFIVKPLKAIERAATKVANGEIDKKVEVPKSKDELQALALAYNNMIDNLKTMVKDINVNFEETNGKVMDMKEACKDAANRSETVNSTVDQITAGAESSAASIQNTASSMEEVTQIATQVQVNAENSSKLSNEMVETLGDTKLVIQSLVNGIQKLAVENKNSLSAVNRLDMHAKKVGEIISLVGDIAEQTNLLALNASIEAARAGEQGRGFAVVADEVRKLADESGKAVQGISELIHNIQMEVANVVNQITEQVQAATKESEKGSQTTEAIAEMSTSVNEVAASVEEILQLVERQVSTIKATNEDAQQVAAVAEETSAAALDVSSVTEEQMAMMEEVSASADQLLDQANQLKETISKFKL
ncbi:methyl-accepting chemotaxis protein [Evansella tamaricis]|uniref:Methyl-accepting chemotaxis protein n=1 Tax=Evansella tamaricis TaxID=2069301 RepID=A0ABS6JAZ3_9BACI|nr:methyl-accepting chemotaxis protein [Evansella tamaricis]MBU9710851.1 methyl-accepting chemotaxis protein [Evansella tamaricis]